MEKELEQYKQVLSEQSEVFKHKLSLFQNFFIQEYLPKKRAESDINNTMLEYYGKIGLLGNINTLKAIVNTKLIEVGNGIDQNDVEQTYLLLLSLRQELNANIKNDKSILSDYVKVLFQIFTPNAIIEGLKSSVESTNYFNKGDFTYIPLGSLIDLKSGTNLRDLNKGNGFEYIRIKDLSSFDNIKGENYEIKNHLNLMDIQDTILISTVGTIGKIAYIKDKSNAIVSGNLAMGKINIKTIDPYFLEIIWGTDYIQSQLQLFYVGAIQRFISLFSLKNIMIPMLSIDSQIQLVEKVKKEGISKIIEELNEILPKFISKEQLLVQQIYDLYSNHPAIQDIKLSPKNVFPQTGYSPDILIELKNGKKMIIEFKNGRAESKKNEELRSKILDLSREAGFDLLVMFEYDLKSLQASINEFIND